MGAFLCSVWPLANHRASPPIEKEGLIFISPIAGCQTEGIIHAKQCLSTELRSGSGILSKMSGAPSCTRSLGVWLSTQVMCYRDGEILLGWRRTY